MDIAQSIDWDSIESVLMGHYQVGTSREGADAYSPLLLFKCLLLQKWFHIDSDPELESQINDRISFKKFLGLSFNDPSPDHSTFSRFRKRLTKNTMDQIHPVTNFETVTHNFRCLFVKHFYLNLHKNCLNL